MVEEDGEKDLRSADKDKRIGREGDLVYASEYSTDILKSCKRCRSVIFQILTIPKSSFDYYAVMCKQCMIDSIILFHIDTIRFVEHYPKQHLNFIP